MTRWWVLGWMMWPSFATAQTERRIDSALCEVQLTHVDSLVRRTLFRRLQSYTVTDLEDFAGTSFTHEDERADARSFYLPDFELKTDAPWREEFWQEYSNLERAFYFYDVGFKNLEADAEDVNSAVARRLNQYRHTSIRFRASEPRRTTLETLHRFRWAFHQRVIDDYRERSTPRDVFSVRDDDQMRRANQHSNVDVLGVSEKRLARTASRHAISQSLLMTLQISYDQPAEFQRPSLDGLLKTLGQSPTHDRMLPFMYRLRGERRDEFIENFWRSYGHLRVCEIARYRKHRRTPDVIEARMLFEAFKRIVQRRCQLVVGSQSTGVFQLFEHLGVTRDRRLPNHSKNPEYLVILPVNSPQFWVTYGQLGRTAGLH